MDPMTLVTQYNLLQNGPPEESKLATYMVCMIYNKWVYKYLFSQN